MQLAALDGARQQQGRPRRTKVGKSFPRQVIATLIGCAARRLRPPRSVPMGPVLSTGSSPQWSTCKATVP
eukprot:447021-Pyramimonas_sp.AAC.1